MSRTHNEFVSIVAKINPTIEIVGEYINAHERIAVKCKKCGFEWNPKAYSLTQGKSCKHCSAKKGAENNKGKTGLKTSDGFLNEMLAVDSTIKIVGEYVNTHTDIECLCSVCNNIWKAKPYSLLQGHGCPRCAKSGTSFMEQFIKISFEKALGTDSVVSRDRKLIGMELDIYIPSLNLAIEPGNWYLHKKSLKRDKQKRDRCNEIGVRLITVYDKFPLNTDKPFADDCYVFNDDLNKADHSIITNLVVELFEIVSIQYDFNNELWAEIETLAYKNSKAKNHSDFVESMRAIHPDIEVLGEYFNSNKRVLVRCSVCGNEWNGVPSNMLAGDGCKKCGVKLAHSKFIKEQELFNQEVENVNPDIEIIGEYTGRHNTIKARCKVCGFEWNPRASSLLRGSNHKGWKTIHKNILKK